MPQYLYALDLAMELTGLVIFDMDTFEPVLITTIRTDKRQTHGRRLHHLRTEIARLGKPYIPSAVAIERGFSRFNNTTQVLFRVHGVVNELFFMYEQTYYPPKVVKKIVGGSGSATKIKVMKVIEHNCKDIIFADDNQSDAFGVGCTYLIKERGMAWEIPKRARATKKSTKK